MKTDIDITQAKQDVTDLFNDLAPVVEELVDGYSKELDRIIEKIVDVKALTNDDIRQFMLELSIETYLFGVSKDAAALKSECAETLMKESIAKSYVGADGTIQVRTNTSLIETLDKQVVKLLYEAVSSLCKTKIDEAHRLVNTLNSILISRNAEAKIAVCNADNLADKEENLFEKQSLFG